MRRHNSRWLPLVFTTLIALGMTRTGQADPIQFTSSGDIGNPSGTPIGSFQINPSSGYLLGPGSISLATFQAEPLPAGAGLTYTNMPFYINVNFFPQPTNWSVDPSELTIQGVLNGTITGTTSSNVLATVTSITSTGPNPLPFSLSSFNVLMPQTLAPSGINGGTTTLGGQVTSLSTPEPTPLAMMAILSIGVGLRLGIRRIRDRAR